MFIPIGDDNTRRRRFPFFVWLILSVNVVFWLCELSVGDAFVMAYSAIPFEIWHGVDLTSAEIVQVGTQRIALDHAPGPSPIYLTLLSAMFMHGSWMHIIGNMLYLIIFADQIEDELGHVKFICFYLGCGIAASVAHVASDPQSVIPSLGASGAIAGVLGAYLVTHPFNRVRVLMYGGAQEVPAIFVLLLWAVLQVLGQFEAIAGAQDGVAYMAHLGGFVAGVVLIKVLLPRRRTRRM